MRPARTAADIAALAQLACLLEVSAPKPGNVSPGRHFADLTVRGLPDQRRRDRSAVHARRAISRVGETIRQADRGDGVLDEDQHESRHRAAARAAGQRRSAVKRGV